MCDNERKLDSTVTAKTVLVTGASSGIGLAIAFEFAKHGLRVYAGVRETSDVSVLRGYISAGLPIVIVYLDVCSDESVSRAKAKVGSIDILVNNAGVGMYPLSFEQTNIADVRTLFETNFFGVIRVTHAFVPDMRQRGSGSVVMISSMMGSVVFPSGYGYHASKFALRALSESLAMELKSFGVQVVIIEPGVTDTPLWGKFRPITCMPEYDPIILRKKRLFASLVKNATPPSVVADAVFSAVHCASPFLVRVGEDARTLSSAHEALDEWLSAFSQTDDTKFYDLALHLFSKDFVGVFENTTSDFFDEK